MRDQVVHRIARGWREKWKHEDILINHRLTWLLASQALLLGAYGLLVERLSNRQDCCAAKQEQHLLFLLDAIPKLGFFCSLFLWIGVCGAVLAMIKIKHASTSKPDVSRLTTFLGWLCANGLPMVFCVAWVLVEQNQQSTIQASETGIGTPLLAAEPAPTAAPSVLARDASHAGAPRAARVSSNAAPGEEVGGARYEPLQCVEGLPPASAAGMSVGYSVSSDGPIDL